MRTLARSSGGEQAFHRIRANVVDGDFAALKLGRRFGCASGGPFDCGLTYCSAFHGPPPRLRSMLLVAAEQGADFWVNGEGRAGSKNYIS